MGFSEDTLGNRGRAFRTALRRSVGELETRVWVTQYLRLWFLNRKLGSRGREGHRRFMNA